MSANGIAAASIGEMLLIIGVLLLSWASSASPLDFGVLRPFQHVNGQILRLGTEEKHYKLLGLKANTGYEVRVSWPASIPAAVRFQLQDGVNLRKAARSQQSLGSGKPSAAPAAPHKRWYWGGRSGRRLLDTEKFVINTDKRGRVQGVVEPVVTFSAVGRSVHRDGPAAGVTQLVYNIVLAELVGGLPKDTIPVTVAVVLAGLLGLVWSLYWSGQVFPKLLAWITSAPATSAAVPEAAFSKRDTLASQLVSNSYINQGAAALAARKKQVKALLSNRRLPQHGWDEVTIQLLLQDLALMDSNNFPGQVGLGEREGRVACPLVAAAHGRLAHGIGRSGDITAEQPKAAGSSVLAKLSADLAADALRLAGLADMGPAVVLPSATGMALTLVLLAAAAAPAAVRAAMPSDAAAAAAVQPTSDLQQQQQQQHCKALPPHLVAASTGPSPLPRYVVWSRIDQKTCLKSITAANLVPVVVELQRHGDELVTDVAGIAAAIEQLGPASVAAVVTTTSCFAPRASDDIVSVAKLCQRLSVPHVINNAYGVQSRVLTAAVTAACRRGRVDAIVQSTDKNFMVPVGGALITAPAGRDRAGGFSRGWLIDAVARNYPGRASMTAHWDLLVTLLYWGVIGWTEKLQQREELVEYLKQKLAAAAAEVGERVLATPGNPISLGMTLDGLAAASTAAAAAAATCKATPEAAAAGQVPPALSAMQGSRPVVEIAIATSIQETTAAQETAALETAALHHTAVLPTQLVAAADEAAAVDLSAQTDAIAGTKQNSSRSRSDTGGGGNGGGGGTEPARKLPADVSFLGAMLWARNVSGTRVLTGGKQQTVAGLTFQDYGCHIAGYPHPYVTAAAAIGGTRQEVDVFVGRLTKAYKELMRKWDSS